MRRGYFAIALVLVCLRSMAQDYKVERTSSEFDRFDNFSGPTIALETRSGDKVWIYALHGRAKNGVGSFWHVGFSTVYTDTDWRFFGSASLPGGDRLEAKSLRRKVGSCAGSRCVYDEAAYVQLTREQVERASTDGFRVRWNPQRSDSIETTIPGAYFAAMVAASNNAPGGKDGVTVDNRKSGDVAATSSSTPVLPMAESEKRRADQAVIEPVQDAARRSAFLRMAPSLTPHSGGRVLDRLNRTILGQSTSERGSVGCCVQRRREVRRLGRNPNSD